jgi:hypothetical protein
LGARWKTVLAPEAQDKGGAPARQVSRLAASIDVESAELAVEWARFGGEDGIQTFGRFSGFIPLVCSGSFGKWPKKLDGKGRNWR